MSKRLLDRLCIVYKPRINNYFIMRSARTWITNKQSHVYMSHKPVLGKISDDATAKDFVYTLLPSERQLLYEELKKTMEQKENAQDLVSPPTTAQLLTAFQCGFWPFIGFGFFDNSIMILAGDFIEYEFGQLLHISTMAAAALGNLVSDVCGMWLAVRVESVCRRFGIHMPHLTSSQLEMRKTKIVMASGRVLGISIGCVIGMAPLLFT
ncbi:transmembrane protein 65-like isoform X1 [Crassostrea virginica]|uniref:Transmembrane protein 65-like isoform X1 n=1 Tax=Crassostrea virginica TaxID=6565 RepID=A0A8B8CWN9_CRAVI|nr:transmembrane protein 65-like isoform X1 [Crassostrea virginica]